MSAPLAGGHEIVRYIQYQLMQVRDDLGLLHLQMPVGHMSERNPNGLSFNTLHIEGRAGKLKRAGITQNEMKAGEGYSK